MSKTIQPKTKESPRFDLFSVEVLTLDRKGDKNALLRQFETEFAASQQRIQTLKAETDAIAQKTDAILLALSSENKPPISGRCDRAGNRATAARAKELLFRKKNGTR